MAELQERLQTFFGTRYAIERELGGGGMSRVFLAEETALNRRVVIKVLPPEMGAGVNKERFELETQLAASLQHPLIVPILTAGSAAPQEPDLLYYVMPFIDGMALRERVDREGELPLQEGIRIMRDVADALARAHEAGVVHRDIKPDNVMLSGKHAMVTDFGIAKAVSSAPEEKSGALTQMGMSLGTPMYMSPEQAAGDPNIDHRADIYSLGVMAYEMFTGRLPFEADTAQGLLAAHISQTPQPIRERRSAIPVPLAEAIMRCLEKKPADRWQSADQLADLLEAAAATSGSMTPMATQAVSVGGFVSNQSPLKVGGTFALAGLVLLGVIYLLMMQLGLPYWTLWGAMALTGATVTAAVASSARGGQGWSSLQRVLKNGFLLFAGLIAGYSAMRFMGIGPVGTLVAAGVLDDQGKLILAEFDNRTPDSTLSESVTELLRIDLAQSEKVTLMAPGQVSQVLRRMQRDPNTPVTMDLAREIAEREGVKAVLGGEIRSLAGDYIVSATLVATTTGETLAAARETASGGSLVDAVDRLSASLRAKIGESLRTIRADAPLESVTTGSTEALRLYAQADRANNATDQDRAVLLLQQAIDTDSLFAMAHRKLGIVLSNQNREPQRAQAAFTRAYELRDRLTDRERYLAEAAYFDYVVDDTQAAELAYTTLLERYPNEPTALNNLAVQFRGKGRLEDAAALYSRSISAGGAPSVTFTNAMQTMFQLGWTDSTFAVLERFKNEYPDHPAILSTTANLRSAVFDYEGANAALTEWAAQLAAANPFIELQIVLLRASIDGIHGRLDAARAGLREAFEIQDRIGASFIPQAPEVFEAIIGALISTYYLGEPAAGLRDMNRRLDAIRYDTLPIGKRDDVQIATLYARSGSVDKARETIRMFEQERGLSGSERDRPIELWSAYAAIAIEEGRWTDAVDLLQKGRRQSEAEACDLCYLGDLGEAWLGAGQPDSALIPLRQYLETPSLFRAQNDNFGLWWVLILQGEAYEALGQNQEAALSYSRLLDLWSDADDQLDPVIDDLRARVARLTGEITR